MKITVDWQDPILLFKNRREWYEKETISEIRNIPGVYYFAREFGESSYPFYIGETLTLQSRLKQHLKSIDIVDALRGNKTERTKTIAHGARYFHYGYLQGNPQDKKKRLKIIQKLLITDALSNNLPLLNKHGTLVTTHEIQFTGSKAGRGMYSKTSNIAAK
ncbi:MAG: hypothetical protein EOP84_13230 [Verrucomicrobiaceae bacterium]|nr:MAG: hypothetical protein EOP84_13230 [Verrucomicrobiaceae bacterium]